MWDPIVIFRQAFKVRIALLLALSICSAIDCQSACGVGKCRRKRDYLELFYSSS